MILKRTTNIEDIKAILCHSDIYATIANENCPLAEDFEPPMIDGYLYIGGYVEGEIIALMVYHKFLNGNKCHVQILPKHRRKYAKKFGEQSLLFRGTLPLYAEIPSLYRHVLFFALSNNFKVIGVKENGHIKNGKAYNVNLLEFQNGIY